ncbi:MAG: ferrous iron transport protein A [Methanobacterium sp. PtaU1.Bin242]|nr:MAG: ferrous iron transport protein A [Methanobacterium sp. PtaU1.Bin242]
MINALNELKVGDSGIIVSFKGKGSIRKHLMEMGFVKGANVEIQRVAPLGDPIEVKIKGYSISLRKEEAKNIEIEIV